MNRLLALTALIEAVTGLALLALPSVVVRLLLGTEVSGDAIPLARVAGTALLALGVACWLAGGDTKSRASKGLVVAMLVYNVGVAAILAVAGINSSPVGIALWPAVLLHAIMGVWSVTHLLRKPVQNAI
jgi:hypothetical protein